MMNNVNVLVWISCMQYASFEDSIAFGRKRKLPTSLAGALFIPWKDKLYLKYIWSEVLPQRIKSNIRTAYRTVLDLVFMSTPSSWILDRQDGLDRMSRTWPRWLRWHCYRQGHLGSWCKNRRCSKVRSCERDVDGWYGCIVSQWLVHPVARLLVTPLSGFGHFIDCTKTNRGYGEATPTTKSIAHPAKTGAIPRLAKSGHTNFSWICSRDFWNHMYIYIYTHISIYRARVSTFRTT